MKTPDVKWFYACAPDLDYPLFRFKSIDGKWADGWERAHESPPDWFQGKLDEIPVAYFGCEPPETTNPASG